MNGLKLASFKEDQRPNCSNAAIHVGAAVLAHVARSGRLDAALRWTELNFQVIKRSLDSLQYQRIRSFLVLHKVQRLKNLWNLLRNYFVNFADFIK